MKSPADAMWAKTAVGHVNAVIRVYDDAGNVIETHDDVGDVKESSAIFSARRVA
jgi:hypothetical protein